MLPLYRMKRKNRAAETKHRNTKWHSTRLQPDHRNTQTHLNYEKAKNLGKDYGTTTETNISENPRVIEKQKTRHQ